MGMNCFIETNALSYETNVHSAISANAFNQSVLGSGYLANLGISKINILDNNMTALQEVQDGSIEEDDDVTLRWLNHFYDPTTGNGLNQGGISYGQPSLVWGRNYASNDWTFEKMRNAYYLALASANASNKKQLFGHVFRGLGQLIHLIQDKAVPAHTRNDAHFPYTLRTRDNYERYTRDAVDPNNPQIPWLTFTGYAPVELSVFNNFDTFWINSGKGLSEYTNSNFLSHHTNLDDARYALPAPIGDWTTPETVGANQYTVRYLQGYATDNYRPAQSSTISHLTAYSYMDFEMNKYGNTQRVYSLNDKVHKEYADLLIPRAVGYSAGLLNYFFRGTIDIAVPSNMSQPSNGYYSMIVSTGANFNPATAAFTAIKLKATNTTTTGENMTNGTIQLVVKYKMALADPFVAGQVATSADFFYIVVPEQNNVNALYSATPTELNFDLSQNPIPLWATDVYLQVVFKGTLGTETDAVAVGFKDISEPTPIDIFNNMDKICINGSWYNAGSAEAIQQVDTNHNGIADTNEADVYAYDLQNIYLRFSSYLPSGPYYWASSSVHHVTVPYLSAGSPVRAAYILSDYMFNKAYYMTWVKTNTQDPWSHADVNQLWWHDAVKRQTDYSEEADFAEVHRHVMWTCIPSQVPVFPQLMYQDTIRSGIHPCGSAL